jgi:phosphotransferase system enzyme I (PtsI)
MLTHPNEILTTRKLLAQARETLVERGQRFDPAMPVGGMIEVPAAAIAADVFARELDFLSIGTNDLTQYTLAIDRSDPRVAALYDPMHPAVLRLIARTIAAARRARRPVAVCGEMAGDPVATAVLIGMGLREFSMNSTALLQVKQGLLELTVDAARKAARQALRFD